MATPEDLLGDLSSFITFRTLTKVQERVIPSVLHRDENIVVAAPTGSGKTLLFEVAILKLFQNIFLPQNYSGSTNVFIKKNASPAFQQQNCGSGLFQKKAIGKAVYVCPIKALANEKYESWTALFPALTVVIETGDQEHYMQNQIDFANHFNPSTTGSKSTSNPRASDKSVETAIASADIILTTPERWDSITRRWKEKTVFDIVNSVSLVLLDEIHTVHEERGAALEAMVSRMRTIQEGRQLQKFCANDSKESSQELSLRQFSTRFIAISGTLPNVSDFATWLGAPDDMVFSFSSEDRPVPLTIRICAFQNYGSSNPFAFDRFLSFKLFSLVREHGDGRPCIIFCSTRNQAVSSAVKVMQDAQEAAAREGVEVLNHFAASSAEMKHLAEKINDKQLRNCALVGIAFHHAALSWNDRKIVEDMFRKQYIAVVCTTTTLSLGVNLPAHLVIVKGTTFYNRGSSVDIPVSEVAQMCGRAGRPGLDNHGLALILTTTAKQHFYNNLVLEEASALSCVESQLHRHIIEHVNAEIALGTIHTFSSAISWGKTTFFWLRLPQNPHFYGLKFLTATDEKAFKPEKYLEILMKKVINVLRGERCICVNECNGSQGNSLDHQCTEHAMMIDSTTIGRCMSRLYISFGTVAHFNKVLAEKKSSGQVFSFDRSRPAFSTEDALQLLSQSEELGELHLRQGDKCHLNLLNKMVKFPLSNGYKGGREVREDWHKVNILIQAYIMGHHFTDMSLRNDMLRLLSSLPRVSRFLKEYGSLSQSFSLCVAAEKLKVCIDHKMWEDGLVLKQFFGVTDDVAQLLAQAGIRTLEDVRKHDLEPHKLEAICCKTPPFGSTLVQLVSSIPTIRIVVTSSVQSLGTFTIRLDSIHNLNLECDVPHGKLRGRGAQDGLSVHTETKNLFPDLRCVFHLLVGDYRTDVIHLSRFITISLLSKAEHFEFTFSCSTQNNSLSIYLICDRLVGADHHMEFRCDPHLGRTVDTGDHKFSHYSSIFTAQKNVGKCSNSKKDISEESSMKTKLDQMNLTTVLKQRNHGKAIGKKKLSEDNEDMKEVDDTLSSARNHSLSEGQDAATPLASKAAEHDAAVPQRRYSLSPSVSSLFSTSERSPLLLNEISSTRSDEALLSKGKVSLFSSQDEKILKGRAIQSDATCNPASGESYVDGSYASDVPLSENAGDIDSKYFFSSPPSEDHIPEIMYPEKENSSKGEVKSPSSTNFSVSDNYISRPLLSDERHDASGSPFRFGEIVPPSSPIFNFCSRDDRLSQRNCVDYPYVPVSAPQAAFPPTRKNSACRSAVLPRYVKSSDLPDFKVSAPTAVPSPLSLYRMGPSLQEDYHPIQHQENLQYPYIYRCNSPGFFPASFPSRQCEIANSLSPINAWSNCTPASVLSSDPYDIHVRSSRKVYRERNEFYDTEGDPLVFADSLSHKRLREEEHSYYPSNPSKQYHWPNAFSSFDIGIGLRDTAPGGHRFKRRKVGINKRHQYESQASKFPVRLDSHETQWW